MNSHKACSGRRYSPDYLNFVLTTGPKLSELRLCKKSTVRLLRCSLNFLYRDNGPRDREKRKTKSMEELLKIVSEHRYDTYHMNFI